MVYQDDNLIKINGIMLPGLMKSIEINADIRIEEQEIEGSPERPKQVKGYEDAKITIELILIDGEKQTKEEKLQIIQALFKQAGQSLPKVYEIVNQHTALRNIGKVVFKKLGTKESNTKDELSVSIEFWEYVPVKITTTKSAAADSISSPKVNLNTDYQKYLDRNRGTAPLDELGYNDKKTVKSPMNIFFTVTPKKLSSVIKLPL